MISKANFPQIRKVALQWPGKIIDFIYTLLGE